MQTPSQKPSNPNHTHHQSRGFAGHKGSKHKNKRASSLSPSASLQSQQPQPGYPAQRKINTIALVLAVSVFTLLLASVSSDWYQVETIFRATSPSLATGRAYPVLNRTWTQYRLWEMEVSFEGSDQNLLEPSNEDMNYDSESGLGRLTVPVLGLIVAAIVLSGLIALFFLLALLPSFRSFVRHRCNPTVLRALLYLSVFILIGFTVGGFGAWFGFPEAYDKDARANCNVGPCVKFRDTIVDTFASQLVELSPVQDQRINVETTVSKEVSWGPQVGWYLLLPALFFAVILFFSVCYVDFVLDDAPIGLVMSPRPAAVASEPPYTDPWQPFEEGKVETLGLPESVYTYAMIIPLAKDKDHTPIRAGSMQVATFLGIATLAINLVIQASLIWFINKVNEEEKSDVECLEDTWVLLVGMIVFISAVARDVHETFSMLQYIYYCKTSPEYYEMTIAKDQDGDTVWVSGMTELHKWFCTIFVIVPKLGIALALVTEGTEYILRSRNIEELLLVMVAMVFIVWIDEILYEAYCPPEVKAVISDLPLVTPPKSQLRETVGLIVAPLVMALTTFIVMISVFSDVCGI